jgi:DNA-binding MarR family transcriptional regulator
MGMIPLDLGRIGVYTLFEARSEKREARSEKREARSEKREARSEKRALMENATKTLDSAKCMEIGRSCACYNLRKAARAVTRLYDDFLRPSGIRTTQVSLLMSAKLRGPVTLGQLAKMTVTERTTLTRNLTVLERKGFIRIDQGSDRREHQVSLTGLGEEALRVVIPLWEKAQAHIEKGLGEDRLGGLLKDLSEIVRLVRTA